MRVSLFGLSPRHTNLRKLWFELVYLVLSTSALLDALLPVGVCLYSQHDFLYMLTWFELIDSRVFAWARHLTSCCILAGLFFWQFWTCMSRFQSVDCSKPSMELLLRSGSMMNQHQIICIPFFQAPLHRLSIFFLLLESQCYTIYSCNSFVIHVLVSLGDVISM